MSSTSLDKRTLCPSIKPYHVFLSHRGPDTKNTLASFIYHSFSESGVNVFFDKKEFVPGQELPFAIREAIFSSSVQIAILSPKYAESHWCLEELLLMQNTGATILPVFYGVRPEDIGQPLNNEGIYTESFMGLELKMNGTENRFKSTEIEEWKKALYKVSISPHRLVLDQFDGDLGKLGVAVCTRVMQHLRREWRKSVRGFLGLQMASFSGVEKMLCTPIKPYDVFISHHGPDTKNTLASFIYHSISQRGVNVFINIEEFVAEKEMPSIIPEAISTSSVLIAILSPKYAESRWCLEEIYLMHNNTSAMIIPVFYEVSHENLLQLRNNKGIYANAFRELEQKDGSTTQKWKDALCKLSNISGLLDSNGFRGDLGELAATLRTQVMQHLRRVWKKSDEGLFGLDKAIDDFQFFLENNGEQSEKVKIVGIVGTSGCGKTTLAEEYYYRHQSSFDRSSLLLRVREASKQEGLTTLQSQLLKDLTNDPSPIRNVSEGKYILADRVRRLCHTESLKFLIVIDDIYCKDQLEALIRKDDVLRSDSLVIITSHSEAVLKLSGVSLIYRTRPLRPNDAQELLCRIVFHQPQPINGFEDLTQAALKKCGSFPKFLKSLGENLHLYGNEDKRDWENELQMIIPEILKAICGDLEEEELQIFLDIVCFFRKKDKNSAIRVWNGSGWRGARILQKLEYLCLVEVNDATNCISIPDYLGDLGREIVSHPWHPNVARSLLKDPPKQAGPRIRGTKEASHKLSERTTEELNKMELLDVRGDILWDNIRDGLKNLVWLRWKECSETPILPPEMNKLRVLELMKGKFQALGQLPVGLKEINVECTTLVQITTIGSLKHLEKMTLNCTGVEFLPEEFCELQALEHLVIKQCESLKYLPDDFGNLTNLQHLKISYCGQFSSLPLSFSKLTGLKTLDISNCGDLIIRANIFEQIRSIEELTMQHCKELKKPSLTTLQGSLRKLNLFGTSIEELPVDINGFTNLQQLQIGSSSCSLRNLSTSLIQPPSLMMLETLYCTQPTSNPPSLKPLFDLDSSERQSDGASHSIARYVRSASCKELDNGTPRLSWNRNE